MPTNQLMTPGNRAYLRSRLAALIKSAGIEAVSDTPDFILADHMLDALEAFNASVIRRAEWYARPEEPPELTGEVPPAPTVLPDPWANLVDPVSVLARHHWRSGPPVGPPGEDGPVGHRGTPGPPNPELGSDVNPFDEPPTSHPDV
jgi:hypothetical protein